MVEAAVGLVVVDDEHGIRDLLSEILNDEGHNVELAENAAQARAARQRKPAAVWLASGSRVWAHERKNEHRECH